MSMSINTKPGTRIKYANPNNGLKADREQASTYLELGHTYILKSIEVGESRSEVELKGIRGLTFNSVMFDNISD